jgi:hypothetical protein
MDRFSRPDLESYEAYKRLNTCYECGDEPSYGRYIESLEFEVEHLQTLLGYTPERLAEYLKPTTMFFEDKIMADIRPISVSRNFLFASPVEGDVPDEGDGSSSRGEKASVHDRLGTREITFVHESDGCDDCG